MKLSKIILFSLTLVSVSPHLIAQETSENKRMFRVWIGTFNDNKKMDGLLYAVEDSSIFISNSLSKNDYLNNNFSYQKINATDIDLVKLRSKGRIGRGILFGAITGFVSGLIVGFIEGADPPCTGSYIFPCAETTGGQKALAHGVAYASFGIIAGAIFGSFKIKIPINGNVSKFSSQNQRLKKYSYH